MATKKLIIQRQYKEQNGLSKSEAVTIKEFLEYTEGRGYWHAGTALQTIKEAKQLQTPFAIYTAYYTD